MDNIEPYVSGSPEPIAGRCGVKTKGGGYCKKYPMKGRIRCKKHGGNQKRGAAHHATITGRHSKDLPTRMHARYNESQRDPDLLNLQSEIALIDSRLGDVLGRTDSGESGKLWQELRGMMRELREAQRAKDAATISIILNDMDKLIARGRSDWAAWDTIGELVEQRRKLVESERKRRMDMGTIITIDDALLFASAVSGAVKRHVHDPTILESITNDIASIIGGDGERNAAA